MLNPESQSNPAPSVGAELRTETLDVARAMIEQAQAREWQTVNALHARLGRLLYNMMAQPSSGEVDETRSTLEQVMAMTQTVSELASAEREDTLEQLRRHRRHRNAADLYSVSD